MTKSINPRRLSDYTGVFLSLAMLVIGVVTYFYFKGSRAANQVEVEDDVLRIVTTISPLYSHTKKIVRENAEVRNLISPGVSPHDYQFSPNDVKFIADADILIINGVGLEAWLDDILDAASNEDLVIIDSSKGIEIIDGDDEQEFGNPHIWLSPQNAVKQVGNIYDGIAELEQSEEKKSQYENNRFEYEHLLLALDTEFLESLGNVQNKDIAVFHSAYDYLSRDYGLNQAVVLEETPGQEPTAQELVDATNTIQELEIKLIFKEPQFSPKIVETLASDLDLQIYEIDPIGTEISEENYLNTMKANLAKLEEALNL